MAEATKPRPLLPLYIASGVAIIGIGGANALENGSLKIAGYVVGGACLLAVTEYIWSRLLTNPHRHYEQERATERKSIEDILRNGDYKIKGMEKIALDTTTPAKIVDQQLINIHHGSVHKSRLEQVFQEVGEYGHKVGADAFSFSPYQFVHGNLVFMVNYFKREDSSPSSS